MSCNSNSFFKEGFQQNEDDTSNNVNKNNSEIKMTQNSIFTLSRKTKIIHLLLFFVFSLCYCKHNKIKLL